MLSMFFRGVSASSFTNNRIGLVTTLNSRRQPTDESEPLTIESFPNRESIMEYTKAYNKEVMIQKEIEKKSKKVFTKNELKKKARRKISKQSRKQNRK